MAAYLSDTDFITAMSQGLPRVDGTEVLELGNADLVGSGTWTGWNGPAERAPLPQYPQPADLPEPPAFVGMTPGEIRRAALGDVAFCGAFLLVGALGSLLLQGVVS